jgi:hypothetical protein
MSRAYRIRVRESIQKVIRAEDHVSTSVELLDILPPERMGELLGQELEKRGYEPELNGRVVTKKQHGVTVEVELDTGKVTVRAEGKENLDLREERETVADTDWSDSRKSQIQQNLKRQVQQELSERAQEKQAELQRHITSALEQELGDVRKELESAVNKATAEALKERAAQIGSVKEITEDAQTGSLTIVVEV